MEYWSSGPKYTLFILGTAAVHVVMCIVQPYARDAWEYKSINITRLRKSKHELDEMKMILTHVHRCNSTPPRTNQRTSTISRVHYWPITHGNSTVHLYCTVPIIHHGTSTVPRLHHRTFPVPWIHRGIFEPVYHLNARPAIATLHDEIRFFVSSFVATSEAIGYVNKLQYFNIFILYFSSLLPQFSL